MKITNIQMRIYNKPRLKAVVCLEIENKYMVNDIKLLLCSDGQMKLEFPKTDQRRFAFLPITDEGRKNLERSVIKKYKEIKRN